MARFTPRRADTPLHLREHRQAVTEPGPAHLAPRALIAHSPQEHRAADRLQLRPHRELPRAAGRRPAAPAAGHRHLRHLRADAGEPPRKTAANARSAPMAPIRIAAPAGIHLGFWRPPHRLLLLAAFTSACCCALSNCLLFGRTHLGDLRRAARRAPGLVQPRRQRPQDDPDQGAPPRLLTIVHAANVDCLPI